MTTSTRHSTAGARPSGRRWGARTGSALALATALAAVGIGATGPSTATAASSNGFEVNLTVPFVAPASAYIGQACVGRSAKDPGKVCAPSQRLNAGAHELLVFVKSSGGTVDVLATQMTAKERAEHCDPNAEGGTAVDVTSRIFTVEGHTNGASYHVAVDKASLLGPDSTSAAGLFYLSVPVCLYEHTQL